MSLTDRLERSFARIPQTVVAVGFVLGAALADLHMVLLLQLNGGAEPPQWWARVSVMLYWVILPLDLLALWARRRRSLGKLGQVGAWSIVPQIPAYVFITAAALVWGGAMGRGDLPRSVTWLEFVTLAFYLGIVLLAIAFMRLPGSARLIGVLMVAGLVGSFVFPGILTVCYAVLAFLLLRSRSVAPRRTPGTVLAGPAH